MNVVHDYPPNFHKILPEFPLADRKGVIFTYGNIIYAPHGEEVQRPLIAHESVHSERQGNDPEGWWEKYLDDRQFRYDEELLAHIREYQAYWYMSRKERMWYLGQIAKRLASPLYGSMVPQQKAKAAIKKGAKNGFDAINRSFE